MADHTTTNSNPHKVAFVGHSLIRNLGNFVISKKNNFNFRDNQLQVKFFARGGLKVHEVLENKPESHLRVFKLTKFRPHTIVLGIGDNDLEEDVSQPKEVAKQIKRLAERLLLAVPGVVKIVILKLMPRNVDGSNKYLFEKYNQMASEVNNELHIIVKPFLFIVLSGPSPMKNRLFFKTDAKPVIKRTAYI